MVPITATVAPGAPPRVSMHAVRKAFGPVEVLRGVDLNAQPGEILALVGENGAGKSTLIRVLGGVYTDHTGTVQVDGRAVRFATPRDAERAGIAIIHQELALVPYLSAAENIYLAREITTRMGRLSGGAMRSGARRLLHEQLGADLDVRTPVHLLPLAQQQLVEIAKALSREARVLIMDEPTSALPQREVQRLFAVVRQLRANGVTIIYISHKLEEIYALADRITVLRDGRHVGTARPPDLPPDELVRWMVGRAVEQRGLLPDAAAQTASPDGTTGQEVVEPTKRTSVKETGRRPVPQKTATEATLEHRNAAVRPRLGVQGLWLREPGTRRWRIQDVSFTLAPGEIVGVAGLAGAGHSELLGAIFGRFGPPAAGTLTLDDALYAPRDPRCALQTGIALLTDDRKSSGLILPASVLHNATLAMLPACCRAGLLSRRRELGRCQALAQRLRLRAPAWDAPVGALSGGNQQKVLLVRWLLTQPRLLLLDDPTRGVDVGAKADLHATLRELAAAGVTILMTSSELPELLGLAQRILVMHRGRLVASLSQAEATPDRVLHAAMGGADQNQMSRTG